MSASPFQILPSSHARARDTFPRTLSLEQALKARIRGEVRFDAGSRALYATDASNYRQIPIGLVIPRDEADVIATVELCRQFDAPILSRGAGTSLAGQCCNTAVILDFSKYMNSMGPIDVVTRTVKVQPGIVLDRLRDEAERFNLTFAPDPATHSRCTLGGMIGNNSCGVHALMGGKTVDNIVSLDLLLYDGTRLTVGPTTEADLAAHIATPGRIGELYAGLKEIRDTYATLVRQRFPDIPRRVSGFNLDELLPNIDQPEKGFNVARALVGSEGTCAIILSATLRLVQSPPYRTLTGLAFSDIFLAADQVPTLLQHPLIGLEGIDGLLLDALRAKQKSLDDLTLLPDAATSRGFLLAEFGGQTQAEADAKAHALVASLATASTHARIYTPAEARRVWHIRESGLGATAFVPGKGTGWEGWEDAAVDPLQLGSYLRAIVALMDEYGYACPMYGHFGQGCVHMRHNFDLESAPGILSFREFLDRAADIVLAHNGSLSGEHGDGQSRAALWPKMFGSELMQGFAAFKRLFDPTNRMNPGKLIGPDPDPALHAPHQPHEDLRLGADYHPWQPPLHFALPEDNGSLASAALRCVGVGACRKTDAGTMCPSFMATGEELHSTRGRAHLLWELMQNEVLPNRWDNKEVLASLDLCLSCKACKSECPVSVDMATYKSEFLAHHFEHTRRPLAHHAFGRIDTLARLSNLLPFGPALLNSLNRAPILSPLLKRTLHIHPDRSFPSFARAYTSTLHKAALRSPSATPQTSRNSQVTQGFSLGPQASPGLSGALAPGVSSSPPRPTVLLFADTFNNYFHPQTMQSAHTVLTDAGFDPITPRQHLCCGRPLYDFGLLTTAKQYLLKILDALAPHLAAGTPIVVLEPSCASVFRDELCNLLPNNPRARQLRDHTLLLSEFLVRHAPAYTPPRITGDIVVHGHCHHRATFGMNDEMTLLARTGANVTLLDSGCCGMAGPFGFEKEKFDLSQILANRVLLPAVRLAPAGTHILTNGFSCAEQITQNTEVQPKHLADLLAHPLSR